MHRMWGIRAVCLLLPLSALAETVAPGEREGEIQQMRARIERLEKLVAELRKERKTKRRSNLASGQ